MSHAHGAEELIKDIDKLGYREVILKSDGEPALKSIQDEVKKRRSDLRYLRTAQWGNLNRMEWPRELSVRWGIKYEYFEQLWKIVCP